MIYPSFHFPWDFLYLQQVVAGFIFQTYHIICLTKAIQTISIAKLSKQSLQNCYIKMKNKLESVKLCRLMPIPEFDILILNGWSCG